MVTTQDGYRMILRDFDAWLERHEMTIERADEGTVLDWLGERSWGEAQRHKALAAIRSYIRWRFGHLHPIMNLKIRRPAVKPQRTLTEDRVRRLLELIDVDSPNGLRDYAIVMLMVDTGLRKAEVCRLESRFVDLEKRTLQVQIKGGEWGAGVFSRETADALADWLGIRDMIARPETRTFFCSVGGNTPGRPLTPNGLGMVFKYLSELAGWRVSAHDLRRTFATLLTLAGAPTELVRKAGRWKNLEQVKTYTQGVPMAAVQPYLPMSRLAEGESDDSAPER